MAAATGIAAATAVATETTVTTAEAATVTTVSAGATEAAVVTVLAATGLAAEAWVDGLAVGVETLGVAALLPLAVTAAAARYTARPAGPDEQPDADIDDENYRYEHKDAAAHGTLHSKGPGQRIRGRDGGIEP